MNDLTPLMAIAFKYNSEKIRNRAFVNVLFDVSGHNGQSYSYENK
jgi:hypothetical protein